MNKWDLLWAMIGAVLLIPAFCWWVKRRRETASVRDNWRRADQMGRVRAREERRQ